MSKTPKTYFIVVTQGFTSRYLLRSSIFRRLKDSGSVIVILSPNSQEDYFVKEFSGDNVFHESFNFDQYPDKNSKRSLFFTLARLYAFEGSHFNNFTHYWKQHYFKNREDISYVKKWFDLILRLSIFGLSRSQLLRNFFVYIESKMTKKVHQDIFDRYKPDFLLTTSLGMLPHDRFIMQEAYTNKVKNVALVLSWDNTTTKGIAGAHVDYVVAWTELMKNELVNYHHIPASRIFVGGVVQYEEYFLDSNLWSKQKLNKNLNLDPDKKILLYCLESPTAYKWNPDVIEILAEAILSNEITSDCQLVIRPHPIYYRVSNGNLVYQNDIDLLRQLEEKFHFIKFDHPQVHPGGVSYDMPISETYKLGSLLKYSDIVLCFYSSINIESSIFDTPIINVNLYHKKNLPNEVMIAHAHNKRVFDTGGVWSVDTRDEMIYAINTYLDNPEVRHDGRMRIVNQETGPNKGTASTEIAEYLLEL